MANSKITLDWMFVSALNSELNISETKLGLNLNQVFKNSRLASGQTERPLYMIDRDEYRGYISDYYELAFNLDYNTGFLFTTTKIDGPANRGIGTVIIEANYPGANFVITKNNASVIGNIENEPAVDEIRILNTSFSEASSNKCQNVKINVSTNILATRVLSPVSINPNSSNPFSFDYLRGGTINVTVQDANGKQATQTVALPSMLNAANFDVTINNSPNGATVLVDNVNTTGLVLQYSLNNVDWQSENYFNGLTPGDFTLYVRDQFGCSFSKSFKVNEFGIYTPYFYISKSNSIRYANRITWGDSANYKTDENTLSCEVDVLLPYQELQQFQSADIPQTQFKSNYEINTAVVIKADGTEVDVPIEKKSSNIGIKDKRDARKYSLGNGKTGVYFLSGNRYNFDTNVIIEPYALNGLLPEWGVIGNYIVIANAWFLIEEVFYDETKDAEIIVFSQNYTGAEISIVAGSVYNRFNYEVYEYAIDMVDYIDQYLQVKLINSDPKFGTLTHLSEQIWCKVKHEDVLEIKYYNTTNTDVFYATGIEFLIRIPYTFVKGKIDEESEVHKTDTNSILLSAELYEVDEFIFEPVTKEIWRKLMFALSHEKVWINGVGYVKNGSFSTEGPLEQTNLYVLTANMIKTGNVYNSQGSGNLDFSGGDVEVPGLISTESGFLSYI